MIAFAGFRPTQMRRQENLFRMTAFRLLRAVPPLGSCSKAVANLRFARAHISCAGSSYWLRGNFANEAIDQVSYKPSGACACRLRPRSALRYRLLNRRILPSLQ
jgi:hypothetical protein